MKDEASHEANTMTQFLTAAWLAVISVVPSMALAGSCAPGTLVVRSPSPEGLRLVVARNPAERPVADLLRALLPVDWSLEQAGKVSANAVHPTSERDLEPALRDLAQRSQSCIELDGQRRVVTVRGLEADTLPLAPLPAAAPALAPLDDGLAAALREEGSYALHPGETLREVFERWSRSSGYTLIWQAPIDLPVEAAVSFPSGTRFKDAVRETLGAYWRTKHAVAGRLYKNHVLVISGRDS